MAASYNNDSRFKAPLEMIAFFFRAFLINFSLLTSKRRKSRETCMYYVCIFVCLFFACFWLLTKLLEFTCRTVFNNQN